MGSERLAVRLCLPLLLDALTGRSGHGLVRHLAESSCTAAHPLGLSAAGGGDQLGDTRGQAVVLHVDEPGRPQALLQSV